MVYHYLVVKKTHEKTRTNNGSILTSIAYVAKGRYSPLLWDIYLYCCLKQLPHHCTG